MAWEKRRNGRFYYRSYRDPATGQVRKQYIGTGPAAEEAARQDIAQRAEKSARCCDKEDAARRFEAGHSMLLALSADLDAIARAVLAEAGYYQHHRGEWRRKRVKRES